MLVKVSGIVFATVPLRQGKHLLLVINGHSKDLRLRSIRFIKKDFNYVRTH